MFRNCQDVRKEGPQGPQHQLLGTHLQLAQCEDKAARACGPKGYKVIAKAGQDQSAEDDPADFAFGLNPAGFSSRTMIVLCR